jgi:spore coat protein CotH
MPIHLRRPARTRLAGVVAVALVVAACSSGDDAETEGGADRALFESAVVHEIEVSFDQGDYDAMIEAYAETENKEWIEATVTIDGVTYKQAGLRLKGNSSLFGLGGGSRQGGADTTTTTESTDDPAASAEDDAGATTTTGGEPGGGFGPGGSASADDPESLPWLIRLDQFVEGQEHQGYEDIVIRSNGSETSLNEAVALDLLDQADLASQEAVATSFRVNDGDAVLRLAIEHPDDDAWQEENFESEGALYKAESTGDWSYRGDDPADYEDVFDQEGGSDVADLTPLIDLLQFLNESDDATFAAELPERLDVESFATYLAMMDLVGNFDDIDGPGNNAYLWYDIETDQFTVVPWDMNLALGSFGGGNGNGPPGGFEPPEGFEPPADGQPPEGFELPEGFEPPADADAPEGFDPEAMGGFGRGNVLVERFHANADFEALYQDKLTELRETLYGSGAADEILDQWVDVLTEGATDLVTEDTITDEADAISASFTAS